MGWPVARKCALACRLGELSQHPTWPQVRHIRRWSHHPAISRHSSHATLLGTASLTWSIWAQGDPVLSTKNPHGSS